MGRTGGAPGARRLPVSYASLLAADYILKRAPSNQVRTNSRAVQLLCKHATTKIEGKDYSLYRTAANLLGLALLSWWDVLNILGQESMPSYLLLFCFKWRLYEVFTLI